MDRNVEIIIIGAGLSGLTTGYQLQKKHHNDFLLLESRERPGGRILTQEGIDLGATWFQYYHEHLIHLLDELKVHRFNQFTKGKSILVYSSMAPAHYFESDQNTPAANRISGGSSALIHALSSKLKNRIHLDTIINEIHDVEGGLSILTNKGDYQAKKVIITIPPKLASGISFSPPLPISVSEAMNNTHTWMSNAIKAGLSFERPFWRGKDLSGTIIGQVSPMIELYDHCDDSAGTYSLMGFVNEALRDESPKHRKESILAYLEKYLGPEIRNYIKYSEKDWSDDPYTSGDQLKSMYMAPRYGNPIFQTFYMDGKLLFSGAETAQAYGGYMEGAVHSGINAAQKVLG